MAEKKASIYITPFGKERPRASVVGGHAKIYTPRTTEVYENEIRMGWKKVNGEEPFTGPLVMRLYFYMPIPKSETKANKLKMLEKKIRPTKKPDIDNLVKSVMDALNGIAYEDDSQIVTLLAKKYYGEMPCVKIIVAEWEAKEDG